MEGDCGMRSAQVNTDYVCVYHIVYSRGGNDTIFHEFGVRGH